MTLFQLLDNFYTVTHPTKSTDYNFSLKASVESSWPNSLPRSVVLSVIGYETTSFYGGTPDKIDRPVGRLNMSRENDQILKIFADPNARLDDWQHLMAAFQLKQEKAESA